MRPSVFRITIQHRALARAPRTINNYITRDTV